MRNDIADIGRLEEFRQYDDIIDVRSPGEFAEDHIPGSINCPVLDNAQRVEVGTLYKQVSPFAARRVGAAYVAENIARHLRERFADRPPSWKPLVACWRGGQRSAAMTLILRRVGWDARQLQGGYKTYRRLVVDRLNEWPRRFTFTVLGGATGSAKSRILQALAARGEQVLDLEELACHKGSVLGVLPATAQPAQKLFETRLLGALLALDPARPVFVEAESRKIGSVHLPDALLETMRAGPCVVIEAAFAARVEFLLRDYAYFLSDRSFFLARLDELRSLQSRETLTRWRALAEAGDWPTLVGELLAQHYDPLYQRSQGKNFAGFAAARRLPADALDPESVASLAARVAGRQD